MEVVEDMHRIRGILPYRGDEGCRKVRGNVPDGDADLAYLLPEFRQGVCTLALTHIDDTARVQVHHDCPVHMAFLDGKLVDADVLHSLKGWRGIVPLQVGGVYLLDHIPANAKQGGNILQRSHAEQVHYIPDKAVCVTAAAGGKRDVLLLVIVAGAALVALDLHPYYYLLATERKTDKVTDTIAVLHQMTLFALRTYRKPAFRFHM